MNIQKKGSGPNACSKCCLINITRVHACGWAGGGISGIYGCENMKNAYPRVPVDV